MDIYKNSFMSLCAHSNIHVNSVLVLIDCFSPQYRSLPLCILSNFWIPHIVNLSLLCAVYFDIPINMLDHISGEVMLLKTILPFGL
jgi:hypothetical protein